MTKDEVLKLALDALGDLGMKHYESTGEVLYKETFTAIKEALAQPEQEPVAFAKIFTQLKTDDEPCNEVIALGHMMRDWLQSKCLTIVLMLIQVKVSLNTTFGLCVKAKSF
jgi:hypothetical protein